MLPADFCNCITDVRALSTGLSIPRRDDGHDHLPFLTRHARPARVAPNSGDARRAAHSSVRPDPVAGSSCLRRFARPRYRTDRDTSCEPELPRAHVSSVPIDVHGSPDRVKDVSSFGEALVRRLPDECVRNVSPHADHVPLLILPEGTCMSPVRPPAWERAPLHAIRTDLDPRCSVSPRRRTASRESGCLPPLRPRENSRDRPPAHAAHTLSPWLGTMCF
jgi:hypothetical protein